MASFNRVILVGNLARDVEIKYLPSGNAVADGCVVVNDRRKQGDEWVEEPIFVNLTLWGRTAEVASEYTSKGSPVLVEGRLKEEKWEKDGEKRSRMVVVVEKLQLIGSKKDKVEPTSSDTPVVADNNETVPF